MVVALVTVLAIAAVGSLATPVARAAQSCDTVDKGYQCQSDISHSWGQYSPFFSVPSSIATNVPNGCKVNFVQVLSRHGARDPTASKTASYGKAVAKVKSTATKFGGKYAFLKNYTYSLGADQLTTFGEQEMVNSGIDFFNRYQSLARKANPFVRSSSESRVVVSAQNWTQGFHATKAKSTRDPSYPYPIVVISEAAGSNNTLNHDLCTSFENGTYSSVGSKAQATFTAIFVPPIQKRINADLGTNLTSTEIIYLMELCPFETVASDVGAVSSFCGLFTTDEWRQYDHYASLGKYYGYGGGNPLGPTQGIGFTNELIARLTGEPVRDTTSTNRTLDGSRKTFPLHKRVYADFSHDNDMTAILFAMGVFDGVKPLSNTTVDANPYYSAASTVPFAARIYVEKMVCDGGDSEHGSYKAKRSVSSHDDDDDDDNDDDDDDDDDEQQELVRVIVNDRVLPLQNCGADALGRCTVDRYVKSLAFARSGGLWNKCFV